MEEDLEPDKIIEKRRGKFLKKIPRTKGEVLPEVIKCTYGIYYEHFCEKLKVHRN